MIRPAGLFAAVIVLGFVAASGAQSGPERKAPDAPYVPTPDSVVIEMLKLARVTPDDLVYDLGSGDGRIVIAAAREFGARGVGVELDRDLVTRAEANARRAGVIDRVQFVVGDIFETSLGAATVVTLYLFPDVNLRLRPKLLRELRPGARIVSHAYDMGDWAPLESRTLRVEHRLHYVYLWTVPAPASR